jgi:putative Mg2+ transporter-C (MgtC) family protein
MIHWDWANFSDDLVRVGAAALLGGVIGLERQWKGHWAGLRTHMMVTIGAAIFVIAGTTASGHGSDGPSRVIQGVAAGIGFLGAGTILKLNEKMEIKGLTTASSIWLAAALGIAAGLAEYALATAAAAISLFVLAFLPPVEKFLEKRHKMLLHGHEHGVEKAVVLPSPAESDAEH